MSVHDHIRDTADELTEPHIHTEPITCWDTNRNRKIRHHKTIQPGLLAQLYQAVIPSWSSTNDSARNNVPGSRPPLAVEALSTHDEISTAVLAWCTLLEANPRASVESNLRALVGSAANLDDEQAKQLLADLRRWRGWCNVYLGWEQVMHPAGVRCPLPDCEQRTSLRINLTSATAMCRACGATWSQADGSFALLAAHAEASSNRVTQPT